MTELPLLDAAWLRALHILAVNTIGFHSLGLTFSAESGWRLEAMFATEASLNQASAALGLDHADGSRQALTRRGDVLGVPMTCLCWRGSRKTTDEAAAPDGAGSARSRGYVPAAPPAGDDLLDLLIP